MPELTIEDHYNDKVLIKARRLVAQGKVEQDEQAPNVYWVQGSTRYRVQVAEPVLDDDGQPIDEGFEWLSCTCPNGSARGGRPNCYHTAAVLLTRRDAERTTE